MGISPKIVHVYIQGVDTELKPNGSFELLEVGPMTLEQALAFIESLPRTYPREVLTMDEWCPINTILETLEGSMTIALMEDGTYFVMFDDKVSGWEYEIPSTDLRGALNAVRKYIGRESVEAPALANPTFSLPISGPNGEAYLVLNPLEGTLGDIPLNHVRSIEISRGSFFSSPKVRIEYVDPTNGKVHRVEYKIRSKDMAEKFYRALVEVLGTSSISIK